MSSCSAQKSGILAPCEPGPARVASLEMEQLSQRQMRVTKVIYNYKGKTEKQIRESIQLEIDSFLTHWPNYKFVNSKSHFNVTGGIELQLNFELK